MSLKFSEALKRHQYDIMLKWVRENPNSPLLEHWPYPAREYNFCYLEGDIAISHPEIPHIIFFGVKDESA